MKLVFVHGWSVSHTKAYGKLPEVLMESAPADLNLEILHIHLGRYISFHDDVTVTDIARAFEQARKETLGDESFSCITHSTGGPVIRTWVNDYFGAGKLDSLPLQHLIMLAPANHGSALAQLGKSRVGRIKSWFQGIEPGQKVLDWLELGSREQWDLNKFCLDYTPAPNNFFPFVITGQTIDGRLYDHLNSYTGEKGSDGVVRVCAANMNYTYLKLAQDMKDVVPKRKLRTFRLKLASPSFQKSPETPLAVIPDVSHSGKTKGIMRSVTSKTDSSKPVVKAILDCMQVQDAAQYQAHITKTAQLTQKTQDEDSKTTDRFAMVVLDIHDDNGHAVNDYDLYLLAGDNYSPNDLPKGFFVDRQRNSHDRNRLTYYLNCTKMLKKAKYLGFRIIARPKEGFCYYSPAEFRSEGIPLDKILVPNETLLVEIGLKRHVDKNVFRLDPLSGGRKNFKREKPLGEDIA